MAEPASKVGPLAAVARMVPRLARPACGRIRAAAAFRWSLSLQSDGRDHVAWALAAIEFFEHADHGDAGFIYKQKRGGLRHPSTVFRPYP